MMPPPLAHRVPAPPPGAEPQPERVVAKFRGSARRLLWSGLFLIGIATGLGWFWNNLPEPFAGWVEDWMLFAAAAVLAFFLVVLPWSFWLSRRYTITTRRVIARWGLFRRFRREYSHARGYGVQLRRGPIQRIWRVGTLTLTNGIDEPLRMMGIPDPVLVQETLVDQVEVSQILAHRDAQAQYGSWPPVPPLP